MSKTQYEILTEDLPNAWCEECEHPVCLGRRKSFRRQLKDFMLDIIGGPNSYVGVDDLAPTHHNLYESQSRLKKHLIAKVEEF